MDDRSSAELSKVTNLSGEDDLLKELEKLSVTSKSSAKVDSAVDEKINLDRRRRSLENLSFIEGKLKKKVAIDTMIASEKLVVRSHLSIIRPHNLTVDVEPASARLTMPTFIDNLDLDALDNRFDRSLVLDEFYYRFEILVKGIAEGKLDDILGLPPEVMIHGIMGLSGELLGRMGIDPKKGKTYALLDMKMKPSVSEIEDNVAHITLAEQFMQAYEASNRGMKPSDSEVALDTPTPASPTTAAKEGDVTFGIKKIEFKTRIASKPVESEIAVGVPIYSGIGIVGFTLDEEIASGMGLGKETRGVLVIRTQENR
jgi:hypothetical protein